MLTRLSWSLVLATAAACGLRATDVTIGKYVLTVPASWKAKRDDPQRGHLTLVLAPEPATILCRLEVIEGAGALGVEQADVFLTLARRDFPGGHERQVELRTKTGHLHGFAVREAVEARRADVPEARDRSEVEVYAGVIGGDLVAAVAGGWSRAGEGRAQRAACLGAIRSLRRAR
jgi:hypothetical protein